MLRLRRRWVAVLLGGMLPLLASAQAPEFEERGIKLQTTYVWQHKPRFAPAYSGPHSLSSSRENAYSFTATAALGFRPCSAGEIYFHPEATHGPPLAALS